MPCFGLTRLLNSGRLDPAFSPPQFRWNQGQAVIRCLVALTNGQFLVGGSFDAIDDASYRGLARCHVNGRPDPTFLYPTLSAPITQVDAVHLLPDGKILVLSRPQLGPAPPPPCSCASPHGALTWLKADGSLDRSVYDGAGVWDVVYALLPRPEGDLLAGGIIDRVNDLPARNLVRLRGGTYQGPGSVEFVSSGEVWSEGLAPSPLRLRRLWGASGKITVHYTTRNGTAMAGEDYAPGQGVVVFEEGDISEKTIPLTLLEETRAETVEYFFIDLEIRSGPGTVGPRASLEIQIISDDSEVGFAATSSTVWENADSAIVTLERTGSLELGAEVPARRWQAGPLLSGPIFPGVQSI